MLKLDLAELERAESVELEGDLPPDSPVWADTGLRFTKPVSVGLEARSTTSGEILVRGRLEAHLMAECRRCTEPVPIDLEEEVVILFSPVDQLAPEDRGGEVRPLEPDGHLLDLTDAIREELLLAAPKWVECDPDCKGLCPSCGTNWNEEECDCDTSEPDPRWEALRSLTEEQ